VACDQAGMWVPTRGLTGQALVDELNALTSAQFCTDYSAETTFMFVTLDKDAGGMVECVYTGREVAVGADKPDATDMNTEHTWPQSQGADTFPAECDLHHLYPTDSDTNSLRGNLPFGVVVSDDGTVTGGSLRGGDASGDTVFEPRDVHKGNVARSMAYFAMRYGYTLDADHIELFQEWGDADPVDEVELARTLAVGDRQGAPNPYVVCPMFLDEL
ncbi:MAG: endonuclease, partial [Myxococcota bacterium]